MTDYYVDSNAVGAGTGVDWANAFPTVKQGVDAATVNGDKIYVASDHFFVTPDVINNITWFFETQSELISRNKSTDQYESGAKEVVNLSATNNFSISVPFDGAGFGGVKGVTMTARLGIMGSGKGTTFTFLDCIIDSGTFGNFGNPGNNYRVINSECAGVLDINYQTIVQFINNRVVSSPDAAVINSGIIANVSFGGGYIFYDNQDFTLRGSVVNVINGYTNTDGNVSVIAKNCKFNAGMNLFQGAPSTGKAYIVDLSGIDDLGNPYIMKADRFGQMEYDFTTYLNATLGPSATPFSLILDTTADVMESSPCVQRISALANVDLSAGATVTIEFNSASVLSNTDFMLAYSPAAGGAYKKNATGAAVESSASSWTDGGANSYKQVFTIPADGSSTADIDLWIMSWDASVTINIDPFISVT